MRQFVNGLVLMPKWFTPAAVICALMFAVSPILIANAPFESTMGLVQKIFYYHMPSAFIFLISAAAHAVRSCLASPVARKRTLDTPHTMLAIRNIQADGMW